MPKKILFKNCIECPIGQKSSFSNAIACIEMGGTYNGQKCYRIIFDGTHKPKDCPYSSGILIKTCSECPYVKDDWGKNACPKIHPKGLVNVPKDGIHEDCPLDGIDCDYIQKKRKP